LWQNKSLERTAIWPMNHPPQSISYLSIPFTLDLFPWSSYSPISYLSISYSLISYLSVSYPSETSPFYSQTSSSSLLYHHGSSSATLSSCS